jgi:hypothetical protein
MTTAPFFTSLTSIGPLGQAFRINEANKPLQLMRKIVNVADFSYKFFDYL